MGYNTTRHDIGQYSRLVPALLFWASIFVVVRNEKRKTGKLTYIDGWKAGVVCSLVYSFGFAIIIAIYQQFINPEFYETFKAFSLAHLQEIKATQAQIDSAMKELGRSACFAGGPCARCGPRRPGGDRADSSRSSPVIFHPTAIPENQACERKRRKRTALF